jgi:hypothetical protein
MMDEELANGEEKSIKEVNFVEAPDTADIELTEGLNAMADAKGRNEETNVGGQSRPWYYHHPRSPANGYSTFSATDWPYQEVSCSGDERHELHL